MLISKHVRRKLYEYVVDELGLRIIRGDYRPGATLPNEDALCQELTVSRGVLREAMKVLIQKGLLQSRPKTGTLVCPQGSWNLFDPDVLTWKCQVSEKLEFLQNIMEVRRIIEPEATRLAAERASPKNIAQIQAIYDEMAEIINAAGYADETYMLIDVKFHTAILEACGNELITQIGHTMRQSLLTARQSDRQDHAAQKAFQPSHLAILKALANHAPLEAYRAAQAHVDTVWRDMQQLEKKQTRGNNIHR